MIIDIFDLPAFYFLPALLFWVFCIFVLMVLMANFFTDAYLFCRSKFGKFEELEDAEGVTYLKEKLPEIEVEK